MTPVSSSYRQTPLTSFGCRSFKIDSCVKRRCPLVHKQCQYRFTIVTMAYIMKQTSTTYVECTPHHPKPPRQWLLSTSQRRQLSRQSPSFIFHVAPNRFVRACSIEQFPAVLGLCHGRVYSGQCRKLYSNLSCHSNISCEECIASAAIFVLFSEYRSPNKKKQKKTHCWV